MPVDEGVHVVLQSRRTLNDMHVIVHRSLGGWLRSVALWEGIPHTGSVHAKSTSILRQLALALLIHSAHIQLQRADEWVVFAGDSC